MDVLTTPGGPAARPRQGWGVSWRSAPDAALRLFCLPHTGGGATTYRSWAAQLGPDVEVVSVRLPGRETRFRERPYARLDELVPALIEGLEPWMDRPHAWFGHSMGALLAYEACQALRRYGLPQPVRMLVAGRRAPHLPTRERPVHDAPAAELVAHLQELNGTPREVLDNAGLLSALLPTLRADFAVSETYGWRPEPPLDCPVSVFGGTADPVANAEELYAWQHHTTAGCTVRMFEGSHFFLHEDPAPVVSAVAADLLPDSTARSGRAS
ncbi:thioesterase II family protein [Peterkaempfera bronchialis]|uniref:Thioesterase n=1 Tax=Peterkaempfera bronchialis TaxID=2126346 RepID=A0A345T290_9ACTN|nr:alpha/beta fold hydrolase [Peterkaempfera bronchialis]AXI80095.1 thioesterase [Peterkaempfera bronchialis]